MLEQVTAIVRVPCFIIGNSVIKIAANDECDLSGVVEINKTGSAGGKSLFSLGMQFWEKDSKYKVICWFLTETTNLKVLERYK